MKLLPRSVRRFSTMIKQNYLYVDKTKEIYNLFATGDRYFFLSRPRRFGKTLLISTLQELFEGNRELFEGLWIAKESQYDWARYPVIALDMSSIAHVTSDEFRAELLNRIVSIGKRFLIELDAKTPESALYNLILQLEEKHGEVVILIDEYDKPLLDHINNEEIAEQIRVVLKSFYDSLKGLNLRALFITGVSRFSRTSIFSGLNDVVDISLSPLAASLVGYTQQEIEENYQEYVQVLAQHENTTSQEILATMKEWYNGYRFSRLAVTVYNPFSVLNYLKDQFCSNYWFTSGTPTFLVKYLQKNYAKLLTLQNFTMSSFHLSTFEIAQTPPETILYQTGYLTIVDYDEKDKTYQLGYPNREVKESFSIYLIASLVHTEYKSVENASMKLVKALQKDNLDEFFVALRSLFSHITYYQKIKEEAFYHALMQFLGVLLGVYLESEVLTNQGRIDMILKTNTHVYLFEVKYNVPAQKALAQIHEKKYYERYLLGNKKIVLVGISFIDKKEQLIIDYQQERL